MTQHETCATPSGAFSSVAAFALDMKAEAVPDAVRRSAALYLLDLLGVAIAGHALEAGRIARDHAVRHWAAGPGAPSARLLFDGRTTSLPGFAFALGTQIDNFDAHDGWQPSKGHAGVALLPGLLAFAQGYPPRDGSAHVSGRDALAALVVGYEVGYRAAVALHHTVSDYHTSGAWNALGVVALGARLRGVERDIFRHALGIAEYHGPRSQMMREIANPTMLHDGSGFGAMVGVQSLLLAEDGFAGAPAATIEFRDVGAAWDDLGERWLTCAQYIKPYPICRWAHAAIDAALALRQTHAIDPSQIAEIEVATFAYAADLSGAVPATTSLAQYALAWPVAAAFVRGDVGPNEVMEISFSDPALVAMTGRVCAVVDPALEAAYPDHRLARVTVRMASGEKFYSGVTTASGGPDPQASEADVVAKFERFAAPVAGAKRTQALIEATLGLAVYNATMQPLSALLYAPLDA
ncbi:MAG: MmgE/PrpD family protein [Pseudomonadota bacterium]